MMTADKKSSSPKKAIANSSSLVRLQKVLSQAGIASRRHGERMIREGQVMVNGKTVRELGTKVNPLKDRVGGWRSNPAA
jgi:16S rRNA U516 pseudouridylate synthase RsuA-like enzyme